MVKIYKQPFAHAGTKQVIPDASDPQGFVSNEDGFTTDYELPDTDPNYKPIERAEFNGLMNMVTDAVGELQQFGFAKWQPMTWPQGARVVEGGVVYRALNQTSQQPPHADWVDDSAIGVGQTWKDVTGSRSFDTTYTNTTGRTIMIFVQVSNVANNAGVQIYVDGSLAGSGANTSSGASGLGTSSSTIVPPGSTYRSTSHLGTGGRLNNWLELR